MNIHFICKHFRLRVEHRSLTKSVMKFAVHILNRHSMHDSICYHIFPLSCIHNMCRIVTQYLENETALFCAMHSLQTTQVEVACCLASIYLFANNNGKEKDGRQLILDKWQTVEVGMKRSEKNVFRFMI